MNARNRHPLDLELELATGMNGPLTEEERATIRACYDDPTLLTWEDAHHIIIDRHHFMSLQSAIFERCPEFKQTLKYVTTNNGDIGQWTQPPSREMLKLALTYATH